jgi:phosphoglycolate phosphatase-like HAD superfamily hydrolase
MDVDPLPSWNEGPAKQAILEFVRSTTDKANANYVVPEERIVTFDQDGTLWVEHPLYTQLMFALERVAELAPQNPEWKTTEPFKSILAGDLGALTFTLPDIEALVFATHAGMTVEAFETMARDWVAKATHARWKRPYTDLIFAPMVEVMAHFRANGYRTYIVTGGGQAFVRVMANRAYGIEPEHVIGSAAETSFSYGPDGKPMMTRPPKLLFYNDVTAKPQDIYLFLGRPPRAAFGNSLGDEPMLDYTAAAGGSRFMALVFHDDATREYAYGPANGLADTKVGTFSQALYDKAKAAGWTIISMKSDWKRIFAFEP